MWKTDKDPIRRARELILTEGMAQESEVVETETSVKKQVSEWLEYAIQSPSPDAATALDYVYASTEVLGRWEEKQLFNR